LVAGLVLAGVSQGAVKPANVFSDGMVLQRGKTVPIWGQAEPGTEVQVSFAGQRHTTEASAQGRWRVHFDPLKASDEPRAVTIKANGRTQQIKNVLVGEVWLCSGQSNMAWQVKGIKQSQQAIAREDRPALRVLTVKGHASANPVEEVKGQWKPTTPETVGNFSAAAFFFGRRLQRTLDVPVGLIVSAWGGTPIRAWTGYDAQMQVRAIKQAVNGKPSDGKPYKPASLYNGMIHPLRGYGLAGFTWYQGERNSKSVASGQLYERQLEVMIHAWRQRWGGQRLPFYFVQLPNYDTNRPGWVPIRESMLSAHRDTPATGIAVTLDIGEANNLHPKNKLDVGHRLAQWALRQTYGQRLIPSGPLAWDAKQRGSAAVVHFEHGQGLELEEVPENANAKLFAVAGSEGQFHPATARVEGDTLVLEAKAVDKPVAARHAWQPNAHAVLYNQAGLPASPFKLKIK
jgi:sialate O-acetylesterase